MDDAELRARLIKIMSDPNFQRELITARIIKDAGPALSDPNDFKPKRRSA